MQRGAVVSEVPTRQQGIKVLGCPLGHDAGSGCETPDLVAGDPGSAGPPVSVFVCSIALPLVQTVLCECSGLTWCSRSLNLTTTTCGSASATFWGSQRMVAATARISATLPLALGGLGLRSAQRTCVAAHWASWADTGRFWSYARTPCCILHDFCPHLLSFSPEPHDAFCPIFVLPFECYALNHILFFTLFLSIFFREGVRIEPHITFFVFFYPFFELYARTPCCILPDFCPPLLSYTP